MREEANLMSPEDRDFHDTGESGPSLKCCREASPRASERGSGALLERGVTTVIPLQPLTWSKCLSARHDERRPRGDRAREEFVVVWIGRHPLGKGGRIDDSCGLREQRQDRVHRSSDLFRIIDTHKVGDEVDLTLESEGQRRTVKVTLQAIP